MTGDYDWDGTIEHNKKLAEIRQAYIEGWKDCSQGRCDKYAVLTAAAEIGIKRHTISGSDAAEDDDMPPKRAKPHSVGRRDESCKICGSMRWSCGH